MAGDSLRAALFGSAADEHWGYAFGCDGLLSFEDAAAYLGKPSRQRIDRLVTDRKVRKGRDGNRVVFCRKSVAEYATKLEL